MAKERQEVLNKEMEDYFVVAAQPNMIVAPWIFNGTWDEQTEEDCDNAIVSLHALFTEGARLRKATLIDIRPQLWLIEEFHPGRDALILVGEFSTTRSEARRKTLLLDIMSME